jgi:ABC-type lipoprotein export system ATPase subunit
LPVYRSWRCIIIVELNNDIEQNNIQGFLLLAGFVNLLRNCIFFTSNTTLTAAENVQLALDVRGEQGRKAIEKTEEVLASVGLASKMASFPHQLSGGEQQRVAIARAIVAEPSAILADEPTAALDSANGQTTMTILSRIAKERDRAVLVVTHDPRLFGFADRIIYIEDGSLTREELSEPKSTKAQQQF